MLGGRACFRDGFLDQGRQSLSAQALGQISGENSDLGFFIGREFRASAFFETFDGILPLFDLFADDGGGLDIVEHRIRAAFFNGGIFQGRLEHAEGVELGGFAGTHGVLDVIVNLGLESHSEKNRQDSQDLQD